LILYVMSLLLALSALCTLPAAHGSPHGGSRTGTAAVSGPRWRQAPSAIKTVRRALQLRGGVTQLATIEEWEAIRDSEERLVILDFTATWCGPCQRVAPAFAAMAEEFESVALFVKCDVDELGELAAELGVSSMPTFLFFKSAECIETLHGADEARLRELVQTHTAVE